MCLARNAACWTLKKTLDAALRVAIWVVDKSRRVLDVAKGALYVARGVVYSARRSLDGAIGFLEGVKRSYRIGVKAISALANFTLTKIINIREIYFKVGLSVANGGKFQCRVTGVLMGRNTNLHLSINTRNVWLIARSLANKAISGLSKYIG